MEEHVVFKYYKPIKIKEEVDPLENYVEIDAKYLRFLQGCWVKWQKRGSALQSGIVHMVQGPIITIRSIKSKDKMEFNASDNIVWYCKKDSENYRAIVEIKNEYEKMKTFF